MFRYFYVDWFNIILGSHFLFVSNSSHTINIKIPDNKGQKKNLFLPIFKYTILFFFTDLTAKNQPAETSQIPGTILPMKLHYIQQFFQIND